LAAAAKRIAVGFAKGKPWKKIFLALKDETAESREFSSGKERSAWGVDRSALQRCSRRQE
jgi:hypothetical protein